MCSGVRAQLRVACSSVYSRPTPPGAGMSGAGEAPRCEDCSGTGVDPKADPVTHESVGDCSGCGGTGVKPKPESAGRQVGCICSIDGPAEVCPIHGPFNFEGAEPPKDEGTDRWRGNYTNATVIEAECARVGFVTCRICGAAILCDPRDETHRSRQHFEWHETLEGINRLGLDSRYCSDCQGMRMPGLDGTMCSCCGEPFADPTEQGEDAPATHSPTGGWNSSLPRPSHQVPGGES